MRAGRGETYLFCRLFILLSEAGAGRTAHKGASALALTPLVSREVCVTSRATPGVPSAWQAAAMSCNVYHVQWQIFSIDRTPA